MSNAPQKWVKVVLALVLIAGIALVLTYREQIDIERAQLWLEQSGSAAPILFMVLYAIAAPLFFPGSILTLLGGALFGPFWGVFYNLTGATIGAGLSFLLARTIASEWVEKKSGHRLQRLMDGVASEGWRFVAFVRLVPLFPFNLLNYALGLTKIRFLHYLLATWVFMIPGAIAYTYLGYAGREAATGGENMIQKGMMALALLAVVAFLPRLIQRIRHLDRIDIDELQQRLGGDEKGLLVDVRTADDFDGELGHVASALNIPVEALPSRLSELSEYREKPIAIICTTDRRSAKAARLLTAEGFTQVEVVSGGMKQWNEEQRPIERG